VATHICTWSLKKNAASLISKLYRAFPAIDIQNDNHETPVMICCKINSRKVLRRLLKLGASLHSSDADGLKPIHIAAKHNNIGAFQITLKNGLIEGDIDEEDILGRTPLFYAICAVRRHQNFRLIGMILQKGADICKEDLTGDSVLSILSKNENAALKRTIDSIIARIKKRDYVEEEFDSDEEDKETIRRYCVLVDESRDKHDIALMTNDL